MFANGNDFLVQCVYYSSAPIDSLPPHRRVAPFLRWKKNRTKCLPHWPCALMNVSKGERSEGRGEGVQAGEREGELVGVGVVVLVGKLHQTLCFSLHRL